jgi:hypothetical protein
MTTVQPPIQRLDEVLSPVEVAEELRCSKAHVYKLIHGRVEGVSILPAISLGRRKVVRRSSLEVWKRINESGGSLGLLDAVGTRE